MPILTAVAPVPGHKGRVTLTLDGATTLVVSAGFAERHHCVVGAPLSVETMAAATAETAYLATMDRAFALLDRRAYSTQELEAKLRAAGDADPHVHAALARLGELGLLNDRALADDLVRQRLARGVGRAVLEETLRTRGIPVAVAADALAALDHPTSPSDGPTAADALRALAEKKFRTLRHQPPAVARRRLYGFLARKGHDEEVVRAVVADLLGEGEDLAPDDDQAGPDLDEAPGDWSA